MVAWALVATSAVAAVTADRPARPASAAAVTDGAGSAPPAATTAYVAVGPERLADTRQGDCGCTYLDANTIRVHVGGRAGVPAEATAAAITVTVAEARTDGGYVTVWPSGTPRSDTSVLNFAAGQTRANSAIVRLGAAGDDGGSLDVYVYGDAELIVDVSGAFVPATVAVAGRLHTLDGAARLVDTRQPGHGGRLGAGATRTVPVPDEVPPEATAIAVNVTTTGTADGLGYLTVWPAGTPRPEASVLTTDGAGQERAAFAIVPMSEQGLAVYSHSGGHLIVDVVGWFTGDTGLPGADGLFVPRDPSRAMDTRGTASPLPPGSAICASVGEGAAIAANVTLTETFGAGYLTAWPAATPMPPTSNVNATRSRETVANGMIARRSTHGVAVYGSGGTDVLIDVAGWFTGLPADATPYVAAVVPDVLTRPGSLMPKNLCDSGGARGFACADGLDDNQLTAFFGAEHAGLFGGDYQRATKLPDGRILWLFQDAMVRAANGTVRLMHNAAMVQSGTCFTLVTGGTPAAPQAWIGAEETAQQRRWFWPMGATLGEDGQLHVFAMEMVERGERYLANPEPVATWVASIRLADLTITRFAPAPDAGTRLYGWSVTSDDSWTYLYGNCNRQFGWTPEGHDPCTANVYLARVPKGQPLQSPTYWAGGGWSANDAAAVPVSGATGGRLVNPSQVQWDGRQFLAVTKDSDWFGLEVFVDRAPNPWGPWTTYDRIVPPPKCGGCNTYFASWVPWRNADGSLIIGLSHNRWNGRVSTAYRPTFLTVAAAPSP
jgi:hypothetical protein